MTSQVSPVPDAVAALIQGVLDDHPAAERAAYGRLIVRALREDGWLVVAPTGRGTTRAVDGPSNSAPGARCKGNAHKAA
ncbi:hypothetical protein OG455_41800 [Kitasatospora sp. NBC_01287]|uniref:hypothetical protein n=1 Tax=Kitasatospora sp. NBC_01287 TaxID=2903573 RepID=UPI0022570D4E|nr:hypothetical protein [Kitasatospora sp. NBC_01287]MCX4751729.1 hypothetical protein [Kitasatospora sp. NBC_01287]MCX4751979.1 hypothetical protein [Kitasatospora sp. NBC_01287]